MKNKIVRNSNDQESETRSLASQKTQKKQKRGALTLKNAKQDR
ncbi:MULTISPECIES: hypothetical protein [unclassified Mammaliicoccus]|nr:MULTISPECIES: hypothetical protein [unclassified Mammaliicoccus]